MKKFLFGILTAAAALTLSVSVLAADPILHIDFADGAGVMELNNAEIVEDATRGNVLKVSGKGSETNRTSYAQYPLEESVELFQDRSWDDGMTVSMWYKTDVGSYTLHGTTPLYSIDMCGIGYISVVTSLESAINSDGNDSGYGLTPRVWNDPANIGGGRNITPEGVWQQLTVVYPPNSTTLQIYVDGELFSEPSVNEGSTVDDLLFQIELAAWGIKLGAWECTWWRYGDYEGMIDDFYIFPTALSADDVAAHYADTKIEQTVFETAPALEDLYEDTPADPIKTIDFSDTTDIELVNAEIVDAERGAALKVKGTGTGTQGTSYALWTTDFFETNDWSDGMSISVWVKADESETLVNGAPIFSLDMARIGYISLVTNAQSSINTDGNETEWGYTRVWTDPSNMGDPATIARGEWVNLVITYGENVTVYENGERVFGIATSGGTIEDLKNEIQFVYSMRFGSWLCEWWNNGDFEGLIDDIEIYNTALNPLQVRNKYLAAGGTTAAEAPAEETPAEDPAPVEEPEVIEPEAPVEEPAPETPAEEPVEEPAEAPSTEPEEPEVVTPSTTEPAPTTAPATFDAAIVLVAALAVSGFAAYKAKKNN